MPRWDDTDVEKLAKDVSCRLLRSGWCTIHGDEFCAAILDGKRDFLERALTAAGEWTRLASRSACDARIRSGTVGTRQSFAGRRIVPGSLPVLVSMTGPGRYTRAPMLTRHG
jgi:hypothetical protein